MNAATSGTASKRGSERAARNGQGRPDRGPGRCRLGDTGPGRTSAVSRRDRRPSFAGRSAPRNVRGAAERRKAHLGDGCRSVITGSPAIRGRGNAFRRSTVATCRFRAVLPGTGPGNETLLIRRDFSRLRLCRVQPTNKWQSLVMGPDGDPKRPECGEHVCPRPQAPHPAPLQDASRSAPRGRDRSGYMVLWEFCQAIRFFSFSLRATIFGE
jgi:hypothetical protein